MTKRFGFSVVIPLYNKEAHIGRALDSVFAQSFQEFEVIVVDDGSTDSGAGRVLAYRDARLRLIRQHNGGVSAARNRGVVDARGACIAFLDADDAWEPCHLETLSRLMQRYPSAGAYCCAFRIIEEDGSVTAPLPAGLPAPPWEGIVPNYFRSVASGPPIVHTSAVAVPKDLFHDAGGFVVGEKYGEDTSLWGRIALRHPVAFSHSIGSSYHRDAGNRTCGSHRQEREWSFATAAKEALASGRLDGETSHYLRVYLDNSLMRMAADNILAGNGRFARSILRDVADRRQLMRKAAWSLLSRLPLVTVKSILRVAR